MRKKTENEELAKRAKKLVKKWQRLVSHHFKNLSKSVDSPANLNRTSTPTLQVNGITKEAGSFLEKVKSGNEIQRKAGQKRKFSGGSRESSPRIVQSRSELVEECNTQLLHKNELQEGDIVNHSDVNHSTSVNGKSKNKLNNELDTLSESDNLLPGVSRLKSLNERQIIKDDSKMEIEATNEHEIDDTGRQDSSHGSEINVNISVRLVKPEENLNLAIPSPTKIPTPTEIAEEELAVKRKPLPDDHVDVTSQSDGVNGCYNEKDEWCSWTDTVVQNNGTMSILPYVILD